MCCFVLVLLFFVAVGLAYTYLAGHVGREEEQGAFRALTRGYSHRASGLLQQVEVNTNNFYYCHVRATIRPSIKEGVYHVYILPGCDGELAMICSATCECATGFKIRTFPFHPGS